MDYQIFNLRPSEDTDTKKGFYVNYVDHLIPSKSPSADRIYYAIQLVVKNLLTEYGSNKFNPSEGCNLVRSLGKPMTASLLKSLSAEVTLLLDKVFLQIQDYQIEFNIAEQDKILGLGLQEFYFDASTTTLVVKIRFTVLQGSVIIVLSSNVLPT